MVERPKTPDGASYMYIDADIPVMRRLWAEGIAKGARIPAIDEAMVRYLKHEAVPPKPDATVMGVANWRRSRLGIKTARLDEGEWSDDQKQEAFHLRQAHPGWSSRRIAQEMNTRKTNARGVAQVLGTKRADPPPPPPPTARDLPPSVVETLLNPPGVVHVRLDGMEIEVPASAAGADFVRRLRGDR